MENVFSLGEAQKTYSFAYLGFRMASKFKWRRVKVITVTGGKGGVGKSSVSLNLAVALCQMGKHVMLFDADLGLANIDVMLGLKIRHNLAHVLRGECSLQDIIHDGPQGLRIVPASSGLKEMAELSLDQHAGLIRAFSSLDEPVDFLIVDTAAGISDMVLSFCRAAQDVMMVVCNESTSVADAYAQMKVLSNDYGVSKFRIVANQVHSLEEGKFMFKKLVTLTDKFLDVALELCACIPIDINMRKAIRQRTCVVDAFPQTPAARAFKSLARRVLNWPIPDIPGGYLEFFVENLIKNPNTDNGDEPQSIYQQSQGMGRNTVNQFGSVEDLGAEREGDIERQLAQAKGGHDEPPPAIGLSLRNADDEEKMILQQTDLQKL